MKIPINAINPDDYHAYYSGCYLIDPISKAPARLVRCGWWEQEGHAQYPAYVELELAEQTKTGITGRRVQYHGEQTVPFYDTAMYSNYPLGYRSVAGGKSLLYLYHNPVRIGSRGISHRRLGVDPEAVTQLAFHHLLENTTVGLSSGSWNTPNGTWTILRPEFIEINKAAKLILDGLRPSVAVSPETALALSAASSNTNYPINVLYRQLVVGKIDVTGKIEYTPKHIKLMAKALQEMKYDG